MSRSHSHLVPALISMVAVGATAVAEKPDAISNERISGGKFAAIPDPEGFAGAFAGVSGGALIVGGGANITGNKWAEPLTKKWYDSVFVLEKPDGKWRSGFKLPRPLGYGVSITADDSLLCFGGSDATQHYADSFRLRWEKGKVVKSALPALPAPLANACGALVGRTVYIAGGLATPASTEAQHTFWALDLDAPQPIWQELEPWPGVGRMLSVAASHNGAFYLISGTSLKAGADGKPIREYLKDAYSYTPGKGWKRLADVPRATVAAPSPAPTVTFYGSDMILVVSGDDGLNVSFSPVEKHPGFPKDSMGYNPASDTWTPLTFDFFSRATAPVVLWDGKIVVANGEERPRVRTPEVWYLQFPNAR